MCHILDIKSCSQYSLLIVCSNAPSLISDVDDLQLFLVFWKACLDRMNVMSPFKELDSVAQLSLQFYYFHCFCSCLASHLFVLVLLTIFLRVEIMVSWISSVSVLI